MAGIGPHGVRCGEMKSCVRVAFTPDGSHVIGLDSWTRRVTVFTLSGEYVSHFSILQHGVGPFGMAVLPNGDVIIAGRATHWAHRVFVHPLLPDGDGPVYGPCYELTLPLPAGERLCPKSL